MIVDIKPFLRLRWKEFGRTWEQGVDCWGLVLLWYRSHYGILLAPHPGMSYTGRNGIKRLEDYVAEIDEAETNWNPVAHPRTGDVVKISSPANPLHVGIYIEPDKMLHITVGKSAAVVDLKDPEWASRGKTYYRHRRRYEQADRRQEILGISSPR